MEEKASEDTERDMGGEAKDTYIGDLDLDGIEQTCTDAEKGYVLQEKVVLLKEAIIKAR